MKISDSSRKIKCTHIAFEELAKVKKAAVLEVESTSSERFWKFLVAMMEVM